MQYIKNIDNEKTNKNIIRRDNISPILFLCTTCKNNKNITCNQISTLIEEISNGFIVRI